MAQALKSQAELIQTDEVDILSEPVKVGQYFDEDKGRVMYRDSVVIPIKFGLNVRAITSTHGSAGCTLSLDEEYKGIFEPQVPVLDEEMGEKVWQSPTGEVKFSGFDSDIPLKVAPGAFVTLHYRSRRDMSDSSNFRDREYLKKANENRIVRLSASNLDAPAEIIDLDTLPKLSSEEQDRITNTPIKYDSLGSMNNGDSVVLSKEDGLLVNLVVPELGERNNKARLEFIGDAKVEVLDTERGIWKPISLKLLNNPGELRRDEPVNFTLRINGDILRVNIPSIHSDGSRFVRVQRIS